MEHINLIELNIISNTFKDPQTLRFVKEALAKYNLMDQFLKLQIPFVADALLRFALERLFSDQDRLSIKSICTDHNFTNLGKRTLKKMHVYLGDDKLLKELDSTLQDAEKAFSTFFKNKEVEEQDREFVGETTIKGWNTMTQESKDS